MVEPVPIPAVTEFVALIQTLDSVAVITAGYKAILHIHEAVEECEIIELISKIDKKTMKPMKNKVFFAMYGHVVVCRIQVNKSTCAEKFSDSPELGKFTLQTEEGRTVAIGKVTVLSGDSSSA